MVSCLHHHACARLHPHSLCTRPAAPAYDKKGCINWGLQTVSRAGRADIQAGRARGGPGRGRAHTGFGMTGRKVHDRSTCVVGRLPAQVHTPSMAPTMPYLCLPYLCATAKGGGVRGTSTTNPNRPQHGQVSQHEGSKGLKCAVFSVAPPGPAPPRPARGYRTQYGIDTAASHRAPGTGATGPALPLAHGLPCAVRHTRATRYDRQEPPPRPPQAHPAKALPYHRTCADVRQQQGPHEARTAAKVHAAPPPYIAAAAVTVGGCGG